MDCAEVAADLVPYHLGVVDEETRDVVESHLVACTSCLKIYLSLKRAADAHERPRPAVRERLRAEVARRFPPRPEPEREKGASRVASVAVLARRIPLYQGVALAAIAAAIALAAPGVIQKISRSTPADSNAPSIDTSRTRAQSLHIY